MHSAIFAMGYLIFYLQLQIHPVLMLIGFIIVGGEGIETTLCLFSNFDFFCKLRPFFSLSILIKNKCSNNQLQSFAMAKRSEEADSSNSSCNCSHPWSFRHLCCFQISQ